jgi:hypothetical protein
MGRGEGKREEGGRRRREEGGGRREEGGGRREEGGTEGGRGTFFMPSRFVCVVQIIEPSDIRR